MNIGILALQGDFREHSIILKKLKISPKEVRLPEHLKDIKGLIIPGGESTTMVKLLQLYKLDTAIKKKAGQGLPIYGTCAGAILLAKEILNTRQDSLGLIDISVSRNTYGAQINSFETDIKIKGMQKSFHAIFIRAPKIEKLGKNIVFLSSHKSFPVLIRQDNILISTFHPELTDDTRVQ